MFPSGPWRAHYDQGGVRFEMHDVLLRFDRNQLLGEGRDTVGAFSLSGHIDAEHKLHIIKKYNNLHHVAYLGCHDGEGTISGVWSLWGDEGTFAMRPAVGFQVSGEIIDWRF